MKRIFQLQHARTGLFVNTDIDCHPILSCEGSYYHTPDTYRPLHVYATKEFILDNGLEDIATIREGECIIDTPHDSWILIKYKLERI